MNIEESSTTKDAPFTIDPATKIGAVTLAVKELDRMVQFYEQAIGLALINRDPQSAELGLDGTALVRFIVKVNGRRYDNTPGLFHLALLLPTRRDLSHWLKQYIMQGHIIDGAGDHLVSEALYLSDPEGNGLEIYRDRPRETWEFVGDTIKMDTLPVDIALLLEEAPDQKWRGLPTGTTMGHIHLQVHDVAKAVRFYHDLLGFRTMANWHSAGFLSAGGYHHHIGVNSWRASGAVSPPPDALGLQSYTILLANETALENLKQQLKRLNVPAEWSHSALHLYDPSGNGLQIQVES